MPRSTASGRAAAAASYRALVLADGATWYARLGEASGNLAQLEAGTRANEFYGVVSGSGPLLGQAGAIKGDPNTAIQINSGANRNYFGRQAAITLATAPWSVEFWAKTLSGAQANRQYLLVQDFNGTTASENITWGFLIEAGTLQPIMYSQKASGIYRGIVGSAVADNVWHHYVGTLSANGQTLTLYVDGVQAGTTTDATGLTPMAAGVGNWVLAGTGGGGNRYLFGMLDELAIYEGVALSARQIAYHYAAGRDGFERVPAASRAAAGARLAA